VGNVTHGCGQKYFFIRSVVSIKNKQAYIIIFLLKFNQKGPFTMAGAMELCCSLGLRLLTVETKSKIDCMLTAGVRE